MHTNRNFSRRRAHVLFAATAAVFGVASSAHALVINTIFDSTITSQSDASQIEAAIEYAAQQYEGLFSNSITLNIQFGMSPTSLAASQGFYTIPQPTYAQIKTALQGLTSTSAQISSGANLPSSDPNPSQTWNIDSAEAKALGLPSANGQSIDGTVYFNPTATYTFDPFDRAVSGAYDLIGAAEHEISEVMGRTSSGTNLPYILSHYSSPGVRDFTETGASDYFSVDGGVTNLKDFNYPNGNGSDPQDWASGTNDSYNAFSSSGVQNSLSNVDVTVMNVLGYNPTSNSLTWSGGNGDMLTGFDWDAGSQQSDINPHHGANMTFSSGGVTASHAFSSGENWELSSVSDAGLSLTITAGTVEITSRGTNGTGQGIVVNQGGSLVLSGSGVLSVAGALSVGDSSAANNATASFSGTSTVNVGTVSGTDQTFYVGNTGTGQVTQSGSAMVNSPQLDLGEVYSGNGTYLLSSSAQLIATDEIIGDNGSGLFNQSGGTNSMASYLALGDQSGSSGTYFLSAGVISAANAYEFIGSSGTGLFNQSGGTNNSGILVVGTGGQTDTYLLSSNGTLTAAENEVIGATGTGIFNQTGGSNTVTETLLLGSNTGGTGTYRLSAGVLTDKQTFYVGGSSLGAAGTGVLTVSGSGVLNVSATLVAFNTSSTSINLSGGTINTAQLDLNGHPSLFNWTSGTLRFTDGIQFDPSAASTSTNAAFGSSLSIGLNKTLDVTGNEYIGGGAAFNLYLGEDFTSGSPANNVTGVIFVEAGSTLTMAAVDGATPIVTAGTESFGYSGAGSLVQASGTNSIGAGGLVLGANSGSLGVYAMSDPSYPLLPDTMLSVSGSEYVGYQDYATGVFNQTGGTNTFSGGYLYVGYYSAATGTYNLSGGELLAEGSEDIGEYGTGTFNQTGGTNHVDNFFSVGDQTLSTGTYDLGGGTLSGGIFEYIGNIGNATFNQSGGTNSAVTLDIAVNTASTATYILSAGTLNAQAETIGYGGSATFNQSGGKNNLGGDLSSFVLGSNSGSTGTYILSGSGILSVSGFDVSEYVGYNGTGVFNQMGGSNTTGSALYIALNTGSIGTYNLSGGQLIAAQLDVGGSSSSGGTGILTVSNTGQLSVAGTLAVGSTGRANLNAATAGVGSLSIAANGIVNLNGALDINYGQPANDPVSTILGYLKSGYNNGAWTGATGIISTLAAAGTTPVLSVGYADGNTDSDATASANQIVVKYTLAGDANLDGKVDFTDLGIVGQHLNTTGNDWAHGNFTYAANGAVNFTDLGIIGQNLNKSLPAGSAESLPTTTLSLSSNVSSSVAALPEPTALALAAAGAAGLLARRKRRAIPLSSSRSPARP